MSSFQTADEEIRAREERLRPVKDEKRLEVYLRELTDQITRLRYELRSSVSRTAKE